MVTKAILLLFLIVVSYGQPTHAQGAFQNLDFESAKVAGYTPGGGGISVSAAFPGWSVTSPGYTPVFYDGESVGGAAISIWDSNITTVYPYPGSRFTVLDDNFSAILFGGEFGPATLSQTGLVPTDSRSLQMLVGTGFYDVYFSVSLGGHTIQMIPLASFSNCTLYGGDISSLAGQLETLSLTALTPPSPIIPPSYFEVDDIEFSPESVPEPTATGLFALGLFFLGLRFSVYHARTK
jgi:hypothetical protein